MSPPPDGPARLGRELQALRRSLSTSGVEFARLVGWSQSRVSKIETGRKLCSEDELGEWLGVTLASPGDVDRIRALHAELRRQADAARRPGGGPADGDTGVGVDGDEACTQVSGVHPQLIPPILATDDYLASVVRDLPRAGRSEEQVGPLLDRMRRVRTAHQAALYRDGTAVELLLGEPALSNGPASVTTRLAQLDRLEELAALAGVSIGIVPTEWLSENPMPAFTIRRPPLRVGLRGLVGEHRIDDPGEATFYEAAFEIASGVAVHGQEAVDLFRRTRERIGRG